MPWTDNVRIPDQLSKAAPALTGIGADLHMVHLGDESNQIWHSRFDGSKWSHNVEVFNQKSKATPGFAGDTMVHVGDTSDHIWKTRLAGGEQWSDNVIAIHNASSTAPALAQSPGFWLMVAYKEADTAALDYFLLAEKAGNRTGGLTDMAPALAWHNSTFHMVHVGTGDRNLWHSTFDPVKRVWSQKQIPGQFTQASPALASVSGRLHMVHLGESSNSIWHSVFDDATGTWAESVIPGQLSKAPPALGVTGRVLHMVHLGDSSNHLWHSQFQDG